MNWEERYDELLKLDKGAALHKIRDTGAWHAHLDQDMMGPRTIIVGSSVDQVIERSILILEGKHDPATCGCELINEYGAGTDDHSRSYSCGLWVSSQHPFPRKND